LSGLAKHVSTTTIGSADNRIAPVSIEWKHLYNNRGMQMLPNRFGWEHFHHNENPGVNFGSVTLIGAVLDMVNK
jgi:hypothetical protein